MHLCISILNRLSFESHARPVILFILPTRLYVGIKVLDHQNTGNHGLVITNFTLKKICTCRIVKHFVKGCVDNFLKNLCLVSVDTLNNFENLTSDEINDLLLQKRKFLERYLSDLTSMFKWNPRL